MTGQVSVGSPQFSPDGRLHRLHHQARGEKAKTQVWVIPVDGGEAQVATASKTGVRAWTWSHDGAAIFFTDTEEAPQREKDLKEKGWLPRFYEENLRHKLLREVAFAWGAEPGEAETLVDDMAVWGMPPEPTGRWLRLRRQPRRTSSTTSTCSRIFTG